MKPEPLLTPTGVRTGMRSVGRGALLSFVIAALLFPGVGLGSGGGVHPTKEAAPFLGLSLAEALQVLQARGLPVFFSSSLVSDSMRVETEPQGVSLRDILDELLRPHGLKARAEARGHLVVVRATAAAGALRGRVILREEGKPLARVRVVVSGSPSVAVTDSEGEFSIPGLEPGLYTIESQCPGFGIGRLEGIEVRAGSTTAVTLELEPAPLIEDEIVVTPGAHTEPLGDPFGTHSMTSGAASRLPHFGNDMLRAVGSLPGTTMNESSARVRVRGGRDDEVLILLDGLELLAPYHLPEFDSALSIVAPSGLDRAELMTSGYPAEYGDRLGGVIDLTTISPSSRRLGIGLGLLDVELDASNVFHGDRGNWFASARSGTYRLALELDEYQEGDPRFWDAFGKVTYELGRGHSLRLEALAANDEYGLEASKGEDESYDAHWQSQYFWMVHDGLLRRNLLVETIMTTGELERDRSGERADDRARFEVEDRRSLDIFGIKQSWLFEPRADFDITSGFELRQLASSVGYTNERELTGPLTSLRTAPSVGATAFRQQLDFVHAGTFASLQARPSDSLTAQLGLRYDRDSLTDENYLSPRFNIAWRARPRSVVRLAWGRFYQSQRPNELQVEDGETDLKPAERSEQRVVGLRHDFRNGWSLRTEAFERRLTGTRARYENLLHDAWVFPELEPDRVRLDPVAATVKGLEVALRGSDRRPLGWQVAYTFSSSEEMIEGHAVPRPFDQPHAFRAGLGYRMPNGWTVDAAWQYHTGWPTTEVSGRAVTSAAGAVEIEPVLGLLRGDRLPAYHRMDVRVSRLWNLRGSRFSVYVDLKNAYARSNVRGFDEFDFELESDDSVGVRSEVVHWRGLLPSFGIRWQL